MSHTVHDKKKLLNRVRRLRGQLDGIERALEEEAEPDAILQQVAACRGALQGLMVHILEGHVYEHLLDPEEGADSQRSNAAGVLMDVIRTYLR